MGEGPLGHVTKGSSAVEDLGLILNAARGQGSMNCWGPLSLGNLGCPQDWLSCGEWAGSPGSSFGGPGAAETPRSLLLEGDMCHAHPDGAGLGESCPRLGFGARSCWCNLEAAGGGVGAGAGSATLRSLLHT